MSELLLEIFSGEIPARMQKNAEEKFSQMLAQAIMDTFTGDFICKSWITPRRLGVAINGFKLELKQITQELRGPRVDAQAQALAGFLKKNNLQATQLEKRGDYYFAVLNKVDEDPADTLKDIIITTLKNFVWPKSMIDGDHDLRWVRPIRSILCLLNGKTLEFAYHHIKSGNITYGHRFMSPAPIEVSSYSDYLGKLEKAYVVVDHETRRQSILQQATKALADKGVELIADGELLDEIAGLVEYPKVFVSQIQPEFMKLPREVLIITLKHHQRYLMTDMQTKDGDTVLSPYYLIVANIDPIDGGEALIEGNNKVLSARLSDAKFFYELDLKSKLADRIENIKSLTFHADIGSVHAKQLSVSALATGICFELDLDPSIIERAAMLAKCDLTTNMVKEFPELQGIMGYYYAIASGESTEMAICIRDHYKPQGPSDRLPEGIMASVLALADKLDTLNQMFAINIKPTGSKDPFALRRAAIGALRIIADNSFDLDLGAIGVREDVISFLKERSGNS
ncbi:MAG: glycine--tRNA ligase subunit beta [Candidatus Jidaibacter sp.]|jgi:glycyl-tRNA synthetase beta chain|nr:glycine--tRNA ligase subunit beta [Candidatus Jidaibacter sp.]